MKTVQAMARHSTLQMTMDVYARANDSRIAEAAEKIGAKFDKILTPISGSNETSTKREVVGLEGFDVTFLDINVLQQNKSGAGRGTRTPMV